MHLVDPEVAKRTGLARTINILSPLSVAKRRAFNGVLRPQLVHSWRVEACSAGQRVSLAGSGVARGWTDVSPRAMEACFSWSGCQRVAPPACSEMTLPELRWSDALGSQPEYVGRFRNILKSADTTRAGFDPSAELIQVHGVCT